MFVPDFGVLLGRKCKKVQLIFFFVDFQTQFSKATVLNSSDKVSVNIFCQ